jgi:hypothetical protein
MNREDLDNLLFLLSLDKAGFSAWFSQASIDDIEYAFELIENFREYMNDDMKALLSEDTESLKEAQDYLQKFRL